MNDTELHHAEIAGNRIAYRRREGGSPAILFLPGYASDMDGTKAVAIDAFARAKLFRYRLLRWRLRGWDAGRLARRSASHAG